MEWRAALAIQGWAQLAFLNSHSTLKRQRQARSCSLCAQNRTITSLPCSAFFSVVCCVASILRVDWIHQRVIEINSCRWTGCAELFWNGKDAVTRVLLVWKDWEEKLWEEMKIKERPMRLWEMYLFSLCSFRPLDRNAGQTMSKIQTIKTGCKMKGTHALYEPGFLAFFPQLQVLQRKKKVIWNITAPCLW